MTATPHATTPTTPSPSPDVTGEYADLLEALAHHRRLLRLTTRDLTDEQAGRRTTVSELCLGGLIKHVTSAERSWVDFIQHGPQVLGNWSDMSDADWARRADEFRMLPGETLAGVLEEYAEVARRTDELVGTLPDLDLSQPLPSAPGTSRARAGPCAGFCCTSSARRPSTPVTPTSSASPWTARRA